ncbi:MAG: single-stranded DNA-binding protein [Acidithiobacillales bacterium]|jgi:single-strand DNA-binding protein
MAGSVNKVILVGHLGADPEMRQTTAGVPIARLRVATTETWNDRATGQKQERTEWHTVIAYDKLAGICERYLAKGRLVYIEGSLQTRSWDDKETGQKRYATEIKARDMKMLGARPEGSSGVSGPTVPEPSAGGEPEDDVPF